MRLVLPDGFKHVIDIESDLNVTCCHIVQDDRERTGGSVLPAREARTLCGEEITLGGKPLRYGTLRKPETDRYGRYPGTCGACAYALASWMLDPANPQPDVTEAHEGLSREDVIRLAWNEAGEWAPKELAGEDSGG